ncbi:MAG: Mn-containing catalase [Abditibacteriota bacterium]|nr:Mn-containing catalase [Abditibacteriota bacterium]
MFYHDNKLQYEVRVDTPDPLFARQLQQAIGGVEGEIRVCLQYLFQAWGSRGPVKYRDLLLETGTEEISHIEMLSTAVALNLQNAPISAQEAAAENNPMVAAIMGGMDQRHILSSGLAALPVNSNGVPFDCSHIYASGNIAADMYSNIAAEATGRVLATRLFNLTDDPGMKDMLRFLIARDTMHQNQWLAVLEELGDVHPIPNSFPQSEELQSVSYAFFSTAKDDSIAPPEGRWSSGPSIDGKGEFSPVRIQPQGSEPQLGMARPGSGAQQQQMGMVNGVVNAVSNVMHSALDPNPSQ